MATLVSIPVCCSKSHVTPHPRCTSAFMCAASGPHHSSSKGAWKCTAMCSSNTGRHHLLAEVSCLLLPASLDYLCTSGWFFSLEQGGRNHRRATGECRAHNQVMLNFLGTVPCRGPAHAVKPWASYLPSLCLSSLKCRIMTGPSSRKCSISDSWVSFFIEEMMLL